MIIEELTTTVGQSNVAQSLEKWRVYLYQTAVQDKPVVWSSVTDAGPSGTIEINPLDEAWRFPAGPAKWPPQELAHRLSQIRQLPEGWDSYGARAISSLAIEVTEGILERAYGSEGLSLPLPSVAPRSHGGIELEWDVEPGRELILEIPPTGEPATFLWVERKSGGHEEEQEGAIASPEHLHHLLRKLGA